MLTFVFGRNEAQRAELKIKTSVGRLFQVLFRNGVWRYLKVVGLASKSHAFLVCGLPKR